MTTCIENGIVLAPYGAEYGKCVFIRDGKIEAVCSKKDYAMSVDRMIDAKGGYVSAGFIDIHTHGGGGYDFMDGDSASFQGAAAFHLSHGTTGILPTSLSGSDEEIFALFDGFKAAKRDMKNGPEFLGLHLEGPYFAPSQKGAQDEKFLRLPAAEHYSAILKQGEGILKRWSIAPELPGALELGDRLHECGIIASIGHSDADYNEVCAAIRHGYTHVTHLYSGMSTLHRVNAFRVLGIVEAAYLFDELTVEIIADGKHLPPELLRLIVRCKDPKRICTVTDSLRCAGEPEAGRHFSGSKKNGQPVILEDGVAKMPDRSCFAGSICTADRCVRTMYRQAGIPLEQAVRMMTEIPAQVMGVSNRLGRLEPGYDADICIFNDNIELSHVICKGRVAREKTEEEFLPC